MRQGSNRNTRAARERSGVRRGEPHRHKSCQGGAALAEVEGPAVRRRSPRRPRKPGLIGGQTRTIEHRQRCAKVPGLKLVQPADPDSDVSSRAQVIDELGLLIDGCRCTVRGSSVLPRIVFLPPSGHARTPRHVHEVNLVLLSWPPVCIYRLVGLDHGLEAARRALNHHSNWRPMLISRRGNAGREPLKDSTGSHVFEPSSKPYEFGASVELSGIGAGRSGVPPEARSATAKQKTSALRLRPLIRRCMGTSSPAAEARTSAAPVRSPRADPR